jgi:signal transduction histidine kinase
MPFERIKGIYVSLKFRIVLWMTMLVFVLVVLTIGVVRHLYSKHLWESFHEHLRQDISDIVEELKLVHRTMPADLASREPIWTQKALEHPFQRWFVQIFDHDGFPLLSCGAPPEDVQRFTAPPREHTFGPYHIMEAKVDDAGLPVYFIRVGCYRSAIDDDLRHMTFSLLFAGLAIIILTPAVAYFLALRATRPISWITSTAARLQPQKLDERLPIRGTGDELDNLSRTINHMLDRIAAYLKQNRDFVANAAHELRSPLAAIRTTVDVALSRGRTPEEYANILSEVMEATQQLGHLVNQLLTLAEGDAGRMGDGKQRSCRLDRIVLEAINMFEPVAEASGIELRESGKIAEATVGGDENFLRQVVRNLLDNAVKFSPEGGHIDVSLTIDRDRNHAVFRVRDEGMGISEADLPHLFERFYRGDKSRHRAGRKSGTGLGLSICHAIVTALGGEISVTSEVGKGSVFVVTLPLRMAEADERSPVRETTAAVA